MEVRSGSCRFGLWAVNVWWSGDIVHSVRFSPAAIPGSAPGAFARFLAGRAGEIPFASIATLPDAPYRAVYEAVASIPYGSVASYGEIGRIAGTSARVVGLAMKRNPTPLVIPCHRVTGARGIGGFTPSVDIKRELLSMEQKYRGQLCGRTGLPAGTGAGPRQPPAARGRSE